MTNDTESLAGQARGSFPGVDKPETDTSPWSAHHLPAPEAPRQLRFAAVALTAGLVAIVLATALSGPINTAGSRAEPMRHGVSGVRPAAATSPESAPDTLAVKVAGSN